MRTGAWAILGLGLVGPAAAGEIVYVDGVRLGAELAGEVLLVSTGADLLTLPAREVWLLTPDEARLQDGRVVRGRLVGRVLHVWTAYGRLAVPLERLGVFRAGDPTAGAAVGTPAGTEPEAAATAAVAGRRGSDAASAPRVAAGPGATPQGGRATGDGVTTGAGRSVGGGAATAGGVAGSVRGPQPAGEAPGGAAVAGTREHDGGSVTRARERGEARRQAGSRVPAAGWRATPSGVDRPWAAWPWGTPARGVRATVPPLAPTPRRAGCQRRPREREGRPLSGQTRPGYPPGPTGPHPARRRRLPARRPRARRTRRRGDPGR